MGEGGGSEEKKEMEEGRRVEGEEEERKGEREEKEEEMEGKKEQSEYSTALSRTSTALCSLSLSSPVLKLLGATDNYVHQFEILYTVFKLDTAATVSEQCLFL